MLTPLNIMGPAPGGAEAGAGKSSSSNPSLPHQGSGGFGDLFRNMKAAHALPGNASGTSKEAMKEGSVGIRGNLAGLVPSGDSASGGDIQALREKLQALFGTIGQKGDGSNAADTDIDALARALLGNRAHKGDASDTDARLKDLTAMLERQGKAGDDSVSGAEALAKVLPSDARGTDSGKSDGRELMARLNALIEQSTSSKRDADETAEVGLVAVAALLRQGPEGVLAGDKGGRSMTAADATRPSHQLPGREALMAALKGDDSGEAGQFSRQIADGAERSGNDRDGQLITALMERTTASRQAALDLQQSGTRSAAATPDAALSALTAQGGQAAGSSMVAAQGQAVTTATLPSMDSNQWSSALERQTINLGLRGGGEAKLSMNPAELGPLSISLKMGEQGAQLHIGSHSAQVRSAIEAALPQLRDAFSASGIQLGEASVSDQNAFEQRNFQHQGEGGGNGRSGSAAAGMTALSGNEDDIHTLEIPAGRTLSGGIDLFA